jgi:hypothetical protein
MKGRVYAPFRLNMNLILKILILKDFDLFGLFFPTTIKNFPTIPIPHPQNPSKNAFLTPTPRLARHLLFMSDVNAAERRGSMNFNLLFLEPEKTNHIHPLREDFYAYQPQPYRD